MMQRGLLTQEVTSTQGLNGRSLHDDDRARDSVEDDTIKAEREHILPH